MKRPTQFDVARLAGVSTATVSYVVNGLADSRVPISEETRQRVLEAIEQLGYEPDARAQALRLGHSQTIGLILPDIHNPHFWQTADGVEQELRAAGYHMLLSSADLDPDHGKDIFKEMSRRTDGVILMSAYIFQSEEAQKMLAQLLKRRFPIAKIGEHPDIDCVVSNYETATREAMAHLLSLQHRRIGLIYGVRSPWEDPATVELPVGSAGGLDRLLPYQDGLRAAGLPVDPDLIVTCGTTIEDGYQAAQHLLQLPERPTALLAINDLLAIGALRAASDLGLRVPADLSLVGYDDIPLASYLTPRLTTSSKDMVRVGREAVKLLLARIQEPDQPQQKIEVHARFIVRDSTGPAPF
ncbi:MAG TPA: LacI family DNA-binding transcriptional regulator [Anaerolineae bacterium]|nr:LacI family DNA-binding transcriptional regulator [Anaerolineae bacterium]HQI86504.1 LacI family DNA-binding transcriptional regulator [Anaerolineae bacterium]